MFTEAMCERVSVTVESRHKQPWRNKFTNVMSNLKSNVHMYHITSADCGWRQGALVSLWAQLFSLLCEHINFPKNCMKLRKFWSVGEGGTPGASPLDPSLLTPPPPMSREILDQSVKCHADVMIRKFIPRHLEGI